MQFELDTIYEQAPSPVTYRLSPHKFNITKNKTRRQQFFVEWPIDVIEKNVYIELLVFSIYIRLVFISTHTYNIALIHFSCFPSELLMTICCSYWKYEIYTSEMFDDEMKQEKFPSNRKIKICRMKFFHCWWIYCCVGCCAL